MAVLDFLLKCDLRSRKNTHCYGWLFDRCETTSDRVFKLRRHQLIADLCRSGGDEIQTVVHIEATPLCEQQGWLSFCLKPIKHQWRTYGGTPRGVPSHAASVCRTSKNALCIEKAVRCVRFYAPKSGLR